MRNKVLVLEKDVWSRITRESSFPFPIPPCPLTLVSLVTWCHAPIC